MNIFTIYNGIGVCKSRACNTFSRLADCKNQFIRLVCVVAFACMSCGMALAEVIDQIYISNYTYNATSKVFNARIYMHTSDLLGAWFRIYKDDDESKSITSSNRGRDFSYAFSISSDTKFTVQCYDILTGYATTDKYNFYVKISDESLLVDNLTYDETVTNKYSFDAATPSTFEGSQNVKWNDGNAANKLTRTISYADASKEVYVIADKNNVKDNRNAKTVSGGIQQIINFNTVTLLRATAKVQENDYMYLDFDNFNYSRFRKEQIVSFRYEADVTLSLNRPGVAAHSETSQWQFDTGGDKYNQNPGLKEDVEKTYVDENNVTYKSKRKLVTADFVVVDPDHFYRTYNRNNVTSYSVQCPLVIGGNVDKTGISYQWLNSEKISKVEVAKAYYDNCNVGSKDEFNIGADIVSGGKHYSAKYGILEGDYLTVDIRGYQYDRKDDENHFYVLLSSRYYAQGVDNNCKHFMDAKSFVWSDNKSWQDTESGPGRVSFPLTLESRSATITCKTQNNKTYKATREGLEAVWSKFALNSGSSSISSGQHLAYIANFWSEEADNETLGKSFNVVNDIDLSGAWWDLSHKTSPQVITKELYFKGQLDGHGYTVSGLLSKVEKEGYFGLFANVSGVTDQGSVGKTAYIKNLNIADAEIQYSVPDIGTSEDNYVGIGVLVGHLAANASIENCNITQSRLITKSTSSNIGGNKRLYVGGLCGNAEGITQKVKNCKVEFDVDFNKLTYSSTGKDGSRVIVGGVFGRLFEPKVMPTELFYTGKIAARYAYVGPIFGSSDSYSDVQNDETAAKAYSGDNFVESLTGVGDKAKAVSDAVATWFYKDYYVYMLFQDEGSYLKNHKFFNKKIDGKVITPVYITEGGKDTYVKCNEDFPASPYKTSTAVHNGFRALLYNGSAPTGNIRNMAYLQGVNMGSCLDTDINDFAFVLYDGDVFDRTKPFTVPSFSYVRTFENTNWSSVFIPSELEYDDWKDKVDIAKFWDVNVYLPSSSATKPELGVNTEIQVLILAKGDRIKPNVPYLIRLKDEALAGTELWFTHKDYKNGVKVEDADNRHILSCSDVETNFTFYGHYNEETDPQSLSTKWYALTHEGWWCAASKTAKLSPERVFVTIEGKNATKFYPELYKDGEPLFRDEMKAPTLRINVLNESEEMGETAIEQIAQNFGNEGDEVTRIPSSVIGLKAGNYVIGGKQIVVE